MDLKYYLAILNGNKWVILTTVIVTVAVTTLITFMITPIYTASTTLRVATASSSAVSYSDYMYADRLMNTYTRISTSGPVLEELANKLNLKSLPEIKVEAIPNTELIKITVESSNPIVAQNSANTLAEILIAQGKELYSGGGKSAQEILSEQLKQAEDELNQARQEYDTYVAQNPKDSVRISAMNEAIQLKERTYSTLLDQYDQARLRETIRANIISVVEPALLPKKPSKPNRVMNIGLGLMVGIAGGVGLAFLFENLGNRLYTSKQIEAATKLNPIGKIPTIPRKRLIKRLLNERRSYHDNGNHDNINMPFNEAFRRLHIQILSQNSNRMDGNTGTSIMITSSEPGEGKSTITSNLAIAIAQSGKKVIVVDCDLHVPKQNVIHGLSNKVGLSTILFGVTNYEEAVQETRYPGLQVLTSGPIPKNSSKLLASPQMKSLIQLLSSRFDMVLLDTPAMLVVADTAILASLVDGVVFVARRNYIKEEAVREACRQLADIKAPMIGLVVNEAEPNGSYYYYRRD